jgi:hypothetical protein
MKRAKHEGRAPRFRLLAAALLAAAAPLAAQNASPEAEAPSATYADLADLAEAASLVALVEVRDQAEVQPERAPGLAPGMARLYVEARTLALLAGQSALGESVVYLADVPRDAKGKVPKLKKQRFLVFADPVPGRHLSLRVARHVGEVHDRFAEPGAPPAVLGVRDVMSVPGNLVGESETQLFLDTATGAPVSLTVVRRPGMEPTWGVSWSEIVDQSAQPPEPQTIGWYRLACFLPQRLPPDAFLQDDPASRQRAEADYRYILEQLGGCPRLRT